ncbi:hypothetical protein ACTGZS_12870, partial [Streptococcus suis]
VLCIQCKISKKDLLLQSSVSLLPRSESAKQMRASPVKRSEEDQESEKRSKARSSWAMPRLRSTIHSEIRIRIALRMSGSRVMKRATRVIARG